MNNNFIIGYEITEDGRAAWGRRTLTLNLEHENHSDDGNSGIYFQRYHYNSAQKPSTVDTSNYPYVQTAAGFVALLLFLVVLCMFADRHDEEVTKKEVDRSIISKKVLPHDQSHQFIEEDCKSDSETPKTSFCSCCLISLSRSKRRKKQAIAPDGESAEDILEIYRSKSPKHSVCTHCNTVQLHGNNNNTSMSEQATTGNEDGLVLAEEGSNMNHDEMVCSICMESFHLGEQVAWSRLGLCRHVFHYDCILPWAVLGHVRCPVCRLLFWTPRDLEQRRPLCCRAVVPENSPALEMSQSRFCVQHGLVAPLRSAEV